MATAAQQVQAIRLEEIGLLRQLETIREQIRSLQASESMLQSNLSTVRAKLAGVAMGSAEAAEIAAAAVTSQE